MEGQIQIKQLPLAKFEYEIRRNYLNLYDRISSEQGEDILRFLAQVPVDENCTTEGSVKQAVAKVYKNMGATELSIIRIRAEPLGNNSSLPSFDYLR